MKKRTGLLMCVVAAVLSASGARATAAATLDDATILAVFDQANAVDVFIGRLGARYGQSEDVRALGRMVAADHIAVQQMGRDLARKLDVVPTPPEHDASVADFAKAVALLQSKTGADFDRAYLQHEVAFHQAVVDAIKNTLLPAIKNDELRKLVNTVLPGFESHLAATKVLAKKMNAI